MKTFTLTLAAVLMLSLTACNNNCSKKCGTKTEKTEKTEITAKPETTTATKSEATGTFEGTLPAADCEGILTTLTVNPDSTYSLRQEYLGVKDGLFQSSGVYNILENEVIELITPSSGEKTYFKRLEKGYMLSDSLGTVNQGELADFYVLKIKK